MKNKKTIELSPEEARNIYKEIKDKEDSASIAMKKLILTTYSKKELEGLILPKTWEEYVKQNPTYVEEECYIGGLSEITTVDKLKHCERESNMDRNMCPSKSSAKAHLALIQLERLRDVYRQGWKPDWSSDNPKYVIKKWNNENQIRVSIFTQHFLSFRTEELAKEFFKNFKDLIEEAGDLI